MFLNWSERFGATKYQMGFGNFDLGVRCGSHCRAVSVVCNQPVAGLAAYTLYHRGICRRRSAGACSGPTIADRRTSAGINRCSRPARSSLAWRHACPDCRNSCRGTLDHQPAGCCGRASVPVTDAVFRLGRDRNVGGSWCGVFGCVAAALAGTNLAYRSYPSCRYRRCRGRDSRAID